MRTMQNLKYLYCYYYIIASRYYSSANCIFQIIKYYLFLLLLFFLQDFCTRKIIFYHLFLFVLFFHDPTIYQDFNIRSNRCKLNLNRVCSHGVAVSNERGEATDRPAATELQPLRTMGSKKESVSHG